MLRVTILSTPRRFAKEFERCCGEYKALCIAAAWCGIPRHCLPYSYLETFRGRIIATIGTSFNHTHPDSIELLRSLKADVRIFRDGPNLFHPKLYSFSSGHRIALFIPLSIFLKCQRRAIRISVPVSRLQWRRGFSETTRGNRSAMSLRAISPAA
jgi:hypothetical protein